jgi:hypothetical protein
MRRPATRTFSQLLAPVLAVSLAACGTAVSTSNFKGEEREVAQAISNLQADVREGSPQKVCSDDLAVAVVSAVGGSTRCPQTIKGQLSEVDSFEVTVESVHLDAASKPATATAHVKSTYAGKNVVKTISMVKEGRKWKLSRVQ